MLIKALDIDTFRSNTDKLRLCFFVYVFLYMFEGALRKWVFPVGLGNALLIARDPIVIYTLFLAFKNNFVYSKWIFFFLCLSSISWLTSMLFGHQSLLLTCYGTRVYMFHMPCAFIWASILRKNDIIFLGKLLVLFTIINCIILFLQYFSPQSAWINRGLGGNEEGSGFSGGANGYFRPSGIFSFTAGNSGFTQLVACFIVYFYFGGKKNWEGKIKLLNICLIFFITSVFLCLSRHTIASVLISLLWCFILAMFNRNYGLLRGFSFVLLVIVILVIMYVYLPFFSITVDTMLARFELASESEGDFVNDSIMGRFGGSYSRAFFDTQNYSGEEIPLFGFGIGAASNVGTKLLGLGNVYYKFGIAEEGWSQTVCESGYIIGFFYLVVGRLFLAINLCINAIKKYLQTYDYMPVCFVPFIFDIIMNCQVGVSTSLGLLVIVLTIVVKGLKYDY